MERPPFHKSRELGEMRYRNTVCILPKHRHLSRLTTRARQPTNAHFRSTNQNRVQRITGTSALLRSSQISQVHQQGRHAPPPPAAGSFPALPSRAPGAARIPRARPSGHDTVCRTRSAETPSGRRPSRMRPSVFTSTRIPASRDIHPHARQSHGHARIM